MISGIEAGELALRRFDDQLVEDDGMHRSIGLRVTFVPRQRAVIV